MTALPPNLIQYTAFAKLVRAWLYVIVLDMPFFTSVQWKFR